MNWRQQQNNYLYQYIPIIYLILICKFSIFLAKDIKLTILEGEQSGELSFIAKENEASFKAFNSGEFEFTHNNEHLFKYSLDNDTLASNYSLIVKNDLIVNDFQNDISFNGIKQWKLFEDEDFQGPVTGWSKSTLSSCGETQNLFLGGYCNFGKELETAKTFENIPKHSKVKVSFNFYFIDNWQGEVAFAKLNNIVFWQESYQWCDSFMTQQCMQQGINVCGQSYPDRINHHVSYVASHNDSTLTLSFSTTLAKQSCEASWGIDDIQIYLL